MNEMVGVLKVVAVILKETNALNLIDNIAEYDFNIAMMLDVLLMEDLYE